MKKVYIWDMDGTLIDSYGVIVPSVCRTLDEFGVGYEREKISEFVIKYSVNALIERLADENGFAFGEFHARCSQISAERNGSICAINRAPETLAGLKSQGAEHFVFTHRGGSTKELLEKLGMYKYFTEIITAESGFPRKPQPNAAEYLIEKYGLNCDFTYYVGDRTIDMDFAKNAGIKGILYLPEGSYCKPNGAENIIVHDLSEILNLTV